MRENGISMWFRFAIEPVEQQRPRAVHRGKGIRLYDPVKVKAYKVQLHDLASREYHGSPFKDAIKVELTFYRRIQKSISNVEYERRLKNETLPTVKNFIKSTLDALTGVLWTDDNIITDIVARKRYSDDPHVFVKITLMAEGGGCS
jgi:Holliday junction resolvase RusA-like endonuclease